MLTLPAEFADEVHSASERGDIIAAVHGVYDRLQLEIDQRKPLCVASGRCCHFDAYGHRLFVTTLEMAAFVRDLQTSNTPLPIIDNPGGCRFQTGKLCGVHAIRPFGCRIFFCDPTAAEWQQQQYEAFHADIKRLHIAHEVPYFYVEWRAALASMDVTSQISRKDIEGR